MDGQLKKRLVGAAVLVSLAVIFIPIVLDTSNSGEPRIVTTNIPPKSEQGFSSSIIPLASPQTPGLDELAARETVRQQQDDVLREQQNNAATSGADSPKSDESDPEPTIASVVQPAVSAAESVPSAWAVQLGSFSKRQNAIALRDRLRKQGYSAFVESAYSNQGTVTRVFVGPVRELAKAKKTLKRLNKDTELRGIVVRYPG